MKTSKLYRPRYYYSSKMRQMMPVPRRHRAVFKALWLGLGVIALIGIYFFLHGRGVI